MADFDTDYQFMIKNEDSTQAHKLTNDAPGSWSTVNGQQVWTGAFVISGINSFSYPEQFAAIAAIPQAERGPAVKNFYKTEFFNKYEAQLSDPIEERVLDMMVNGGARTGARLFQQAINTLGGTLICDGLWGPATVAAANACNQDALVAAYQAQRVAHYKAIVAAHPEDSQYEANWLARARQ